MNAMNHSLMLESLVPGEGKVIVLSSAAQVDDKEHGSIRFPKTVKKRAM
jgi:hypothetical protein